MPLHSTKQGNETSDDICRLQSTQESPQLTVEQLDEMLEERVLTDRRVKYQKRSPELERRSQQPRRRSDRVTSDT